MIGTESSKESSTPCQETNKTSLGLLGFKNQAFVGEVRERRLEALRLPLLLLRTAADSLSLGRPRRTPPPMTPTLPPECSVTVPGPSLRTSKPRPPETLDTEALGTWRRRWPEKAGEAVRRGGCWWTGAMTVILVGKMLVMET